MNEKMSYVHELEDLILKCPNYPKQSIDSMQSLLKFQCYFLQKQKKKFIWNHKNTPNSQNNLEK